MLASPQILYQDYQHPGAALCRLVTEDALALLLLAILLIRNTVRASSSMTDGGTNTL